MTAAAPCEAGASPTLLVCFALAEEARPFQRRAARAARPVAIQLTGIGQTNAERALRDRLTQETPRAVFTCGFAGALNPALAIGQVLFQTEDARLAAALRDAGAQPGVFCCAPRIISTAAEKAQWRQRTGADAVEMESEPIHALCRERGIPCATVRAISDTAAEDLPLDFNQVLGPDQRLNWRALAAALVRTPGAIPGLMRLRRQCRLAARRLAAVLAAVVTKEAWGRD